LSEPTLTGLGFEVFERAVEYQSHLYDRLLRAKAALEVHGVPYGVVGGQAVAAWVSSIDPSSVRSTQDVDMLLARNDLSAAIAALKTAGFIYRHVAGLDFFQDGPNATARECVQVIFAGEKVRPEYHEPAPLETEVVESERGFKVLSLEALIRMKLTSYRLKDQVHIQDLINVDLVKADWVNRFAGPLKDRLQAILDNPDTSH